MAKDSITFSCPSCGIKLTIPGNLAGVTGPCPTCRTQIQAPYPAPVQQTQPQVYQVPAAPTLPAQPAYQPQQYQPTPGLPPGYHSPSPAAQPLTQAFQPPPQVSHAYQPRPPEQLPPTTGAVEIPSYQPPVGGYPQVTHEAAATLAPHSYQPPATLQPQESVQPAPPVGPALVLRPEPRQLPNRTSTGEVVAKQMPEPGTDLNKASRKSHALPRHPRRKGPLARFMLLIFFLTATGGLFFGILTILKNKSETLSKGETALPTHSQEIGSILAPASPQKKPETPTRAPVLPATSAEQPAIIEPPPQLPEGMDPVSPSDLATELLSKFLAAKTLEERLPLIETKTARGELAASCLAAPLPPTVSVLVDAIETNSVEQVIDYYHRVEFQTDNKQASKYLMLVRTRGNGEGKVVVDPFLDTYGGRLSHYAKNPTDKAGIFQVLISPLASCYDERVPNREKKLTLKLLPRDDAKEIVSAYFGKQSKIGLMLEDGTYSLKYGSVKACTVMLRWNTEDNADMPYLEALDLKTLDWNP